MAGEIQFNSALLDNTSDIITIDDIKLESRHGHKYFCPNCRQEMITVMGEYRRYHFRHLGNVCEKDSFLHALAEQAFYNEFSQCLAQNKPFYLKYYEPIQCNNACVLKEHANCKEHFVLKVIDLTKAYPLISQEARVDLDGHFRRPDILLSSVDGHQIWIEIWVSHKTDEAKQKEGSIVEIKIRNENDVKAFKKHTLVQSLESVQEIGFYGLEYNYLEDFVIESSPLKQLPCEKALVYSFDTYSISLRLNWEGRHDVPGTRSWPKTTEDSLRSYCHQRFLFLRYFSEITESNAYDQLIIKESADSTIVTNRPNARDNVPDVSTYHKEREKPIPIVNPTPNTPAYSFDASSIKWVDLGLPSKTLWAKDDLPQTLSFIGARSICGYYLPSTSKLRELESFCEKRWERDEFILTGPNGNSISFLCDTSHKSYWLNSYAGCREFAQCFHIQHGMSTILDNDADTSRMLFVRLMKLFNQS